jgi:predicted dehydrogenase/aryl-alcohol dehydrogenase-like predicted oxidoreductase
MASQLAWGIIGTGAIAKSFAKGLQKSKTGRLVAVGSRSKDKADAFAREFGGNGTAAAAHGSYDALLADPKVQAVYIATPHPQHAEWAIKAAEAKKHVLCEKPIGMNAAEAMAIVEAAEANGVFLMEAFMYRAHPQTLKLIELLQQKVIGDVRVVHATFSFHWPKPWNDTSRLTSNALGGGGILDVGCYTTSAARLVAGVAMGRPFADPIEVKGTAHVGATGVDEYAVASLKFPGGVIAQCSTGVQVNEDNVLRIYGSEGNILLPTPWVPAKEGGTTKILVHKAGAAEPEEVTVTTDEHLYAIEADTVAKYLERRQSPTMSWDDSLGNMRTLDQWRQSIGQVYESEQPHASKVTVARRPLAVTRGAMKYGDVPGVDKKVSRLVMGCDNQTTYPHAAVMFDDFFSRGGNAFDTAHIYGGGRQEQLLGQWIKARGVRDDAVVIAKGAHTPYCDPRSITTQLKISLDRLQTDYADVYLMHRDNPDIPVGEFVDVLNEHHRAGRIRAFGGSNWSPARVDEANAYATKNGLVGFGAVSNNFSLARMVDPVWAGCVHASDPASRAWFARTQTPLFAWSSQARGFFLPGRAAPDKKEDAELVRCWYAEDNFRRLERVNEMAARRGVLPINVALAYVLSQPFPTFALIGPRQLSETRTSFKALEIELSPQDLKGLNLEA